MLIVDLCHAIRNNILFCQPVSSKWEVHSLFTLVTKTHLVSYCNFFSDFGMLFSNILCVWFISGNIFPFLESPYSLLISESQFSCCLAHNAPKSITWHVERRLSAHVSNLVLLFQDLGFSLIKKACCTVLTLLDLWFVSFWDLDPLFGKYCRKPVKAKPFVNARQADY